MKNRSNIFKTMTVLVATVILLSLIVDRNIKVNEQKETIDKLEKQLAEQQERVEKLKYELDRPYDDEYAIEIARDKLNLHLPGEIVYYNGRSD
ncbi:MAG: septum formation initiator family protein [Ruminococcaceae bacterium]|nr:septum formation initiator family protein [Oscillospiraceae bacterium]